MASSGFRAPRALASIAAALALILALAFAGAGRAHAQMGVPGFGGGGSPIGASKHPATGTAAPPPPSALPGAQPTTRAAPQTESPSSMDPTAALFDAINRGDLAAARAAIDRGADVDGKNVLGMTPIELSIDLGRNPITFLLLSMRGGEPTGPARAATLGAGASGGKHAGVSGGKHAGVSGGKHAGASARAAKSPPGHPIARQAAPRPVRPTARVAQEQPPTSGAPRSAPRRAPLSESPGAGGGTPVPAAGFLGFAPTR